MDGGEIFEPESMYDIMAWRFPIWDFLSVLLSESMNVIIIIICSLEFFTSVLADSLSLEFEWLHVSSSLQDSSQYSGRSQQCCNLDGLYPSSCLQKTVNFRQFSFAYFYSLFLFDL